MVSKRNFLALEDWSASEIDRLLTLTTRVKRGEVEEGFGADAVQQHR